MNGIQKVTGYVDPTENRLYVSVCNNCDTTTVSKEVPNDCGVCGSESRHLDIYNGLCENDVVEVIVQECSCTEVITQCVRLGETYTLDLCPYCIDDDAHIIVQVLYKYE